MYRGIEVWNIAHKVSFFSKENLEDQFEIIVLPLYANFQNVFCRI